MTMSTSWANQPPLMRDHVAAATRELREQAVRQQLDRLSDVEVGQIAVRVLWLLRRLGLTEQADALEDELDFEELKDAIRANAGQPTYAWEDVEAELDELDALGR
jgi:hypothetical protein